MIEQQKGKGKKNDEATFTKVERNSIFGIYSDEDMIAQLKRLAVDPCKLQPAQDNIKPLYNQILRLRVAIKDCSKSPWRKRKHDQFVNKLRQPSSFPVPDQQKISKLSWKKSSHVSSMSSLTNCGYESVNGHCDKALFVSHNSSSLLTSEEILPDKFIFIDSEESVNGSNHATPEKQNHIGKHQLKSPTLLGSKKKCAIPIGPRFQADVPKWSGDLVKKSTLVSEYRWDNGNSKWLGCRDWPIEFGSTTNNGAIIGNGRADSCNCLSPGSIDCIKRHCAESTLIMQCNLGPAFYTWKLNEMGLQVSNSWTPQEQQIFKSQVKMRSSSSSSNGVGFPMRALRFLPNKSGKEIISYYFNVYTPNRLSLQTRYFPTKSVDSGDEDEDEDSHYLGVGKKS